jgi:hypothetical protein
VNFDGTKALEHSRKIGLKEQLDESFVMEYCSPVYGGIKALKKWVSDQANSIKG